VVDKSAREELVLKIVQPQPQLLLLLLSVVLLPLTYIGGGHALSSGDSEILAHLLRQFIYILRGRRMRWSGGGGGGGGGGSSSSSGSSGGGGGGKEAE